MGKVLYMRKGETHSKPSNIRPVFANNDWEQIIEACQTNKIPDTWSVGDQKTMTINGTDYLIDIIGKNHDSYSDGSGTAPLTFQMHDCYGKEYFVNEDTNRGGWRDSGLRNNNLPAIMALMPSEVQVAIKEVDKVASAGSKSTSLYTTKDKLFLLSEIEVFGVVDKSVSGEGSQYDYYRAGNSKVKNKNGSAKSWWCRSPYYKSSYYFTWVTDSGTTMSGASSTQGVAFAFCF